MATSNLRAFLNNVKQSVYGPISPINTFESVKFDFYGGENLIPDDLAYYIQDITIPNIAVTAGDSANSPYQSTNTVKSIFGTSTTFDMSILNTTYPIIETYFLPWLNKTRDTRWQGSEYPYPIADITVKFKEKDLMYMLFGCRPTQIEAVQPTQKNESNLVRKVTFSVDFIHATNSSGIGNAEYEDEYIEKTPQEMLDMALGILAEEDAAAAMENDPKLVASDVAAPGDVVVMTDL